MTLLEKILNVSSGSISEVFNENKELLSKLQDEELQYLLKKASEGRSKEVEIIIQEAFLRNLSIEEFLKVAEDITARQQFEAATVVKKKKIAQKILDNITTQLISSFL